MERKTYIDTMKCIGIILIVMGHIPITNRPIHDWIFSFHVALFFFISGYLHKVVPMNMGFIRKNIYSLILVTVPYFIINRIFVAMQNLVFYQDKFNINDILTQPFFLYITGSSNMGVMWFVVALFWMRIIFNTIVQYFTQKESAWILLLLFTILSVSAYYSGFRLNYYQLSAVMLAMPIYCLGYLIKQGEWAERYIINLSRTAKLFVTFIFLLLTILFTKIFSSINLNALEVGTNIFSYYLQTTVGVAFIFTLSVLLPCHKIIVNISNGTMVILGFHMILIQCIKLVYKRIFHITTPPPYIDLYSGIISCILILVCLYPLLVWILQNKYKLIRLLAGKR